jgi:zinc/manganese transport system substrate-binding protein
MTLSQKFRNLLAIMIFTSIANASFAEDRLKIVASFSILGDMVEQVVGEHADVTSIVGPDADAHVYQPSVATLSEKMPAKADMIEANRAAYVDQLMALDTATKASLAKLPANKRTVVTAHDAFGYLSDAYGMTFLAPVGIDTEAEPSAQELAVLIDQLKADGAAALFVENITSPALVQQIADETGLAIGGRLFSDALSKRGGPATSYLAMFDHNLETLLTALGDN